MNGNKENGNKVPQISDLHLAIDYNHTSITGSSAIKFDYLVYAAGAQVATFNTQGVKEHCYFLKEVDDARRIKRSLADILEQTTLDAFFDKDTSSKQNPSSSSSSSSSADNSKLYKDSPVNIVIVGGGPTGVVSRDIIYQGLASYHSGASW